MDQDSDAPAPEETLTINFDPPIKVRQASWDVMTLVEPTVKQVRQAEGLLRNGINMESLRRYNSALVASVSGWSADAVEAMPIRKLDEAAAFLARFTNLGRATGET